MKQRATLPMLGLAAFITVMASQAHADCPDGVRTLSEKEQQAFVSMSQAIREALPPTPAGWSLNDPLAKVPVMAPKSTCKGGDVPPGWDGTYTWDEQVKRSNERDRERDAKVRAASAYTPEEQREMGELSRQARDLERKAIAATRTNPDEAARLRAEMKPFTEKAYAIRKAHDERITPDVLAITKEYAALSVDPRVAVIVSLYETGLVPDAKERLQIPGAASAFMTESKELVMTSGQFPSAKESGGLSAKPRVLFVSVKGEREPAETIARLMAGSGLSKLGKR